MSAAGQPSLLEHSCEVAGSEARCQAHSGCSVMLNQWMGRPSPWLRSSGLDPGNGKKLEI